MRSENRRFEGWTICGVVVLGLGAMAALLANSAPDTTEALRLVIRATARSSLLLFLLAFTASALSRLWATPLTDWLRRNRRQLGVSFALSHLLHLAAIVTLARRDPILFDQLTTPASYIFGGLGYLVILAMLATSFDKTARAIGPLAWSRLHRTGSWFLWLMFMINFGKRIPAHPHYVIAVVLALAALVIKLKARSPDIKLQAGQA